MNSQPTHVRRIVLALACGLSLLLYLHRYTWPYFRPKLQDEFAWDNATMGFLDNCFVATYALGQIPTGILCDWAGPRLLLGISVVVWSLALSSFAWVSTWQGVAAARAIFGIGQAGCYPTLGRISKSWFPIKTRSSAQGLIATFFGRGGAAFSLVFFGTVLIGMLGLTWRAALVLYSVAGIFCSLMFVYLFRNSPREHPWVNIQEVALIEEGDWTAATDAGAHSRLNWGALVRSRSIWFLFLRAFASNAADVLFSIFIPTYLMKVRGVPDVHAGWMSALPLVGGALGGVASGWMQNVILRRTDNCRLARCSLGMIGKGTAAVLMLSSLLCENVLVFVTLFLVVKFFTDWEQPAEWGAVTDMAGRASATVFACVNTIGAVGGLTGVYVINRALDWLHEEGRSPEFTWKAIFALVASEYLVAASAWLFIDSRKSLEPIPEIPVSKA